MEKVVRFTFTPTESSPNCPFQFGLMRSLFHNQSSASSCSFDTDYEEEPAVTVCSADESHCTMIVPSSFESFSLEELESMRSHLSPTIKRAHEVQVALHQAHARLQGMMNRASLLDLAISPLAFQSSRAKGVEDHMHKAIQPAKTALHICESMQKLSKTLSMGPVQDVGFYVEALSRFQQHMRVLYECSPGVLQALEEGVHFLKRSKLVDRFHMEGLFEAIKMLRSLLAGQEQLAMPIKVVDLALEHLVTAFERIIRVYVKPMDLSQQCLTERSSERRKTAQLKPALPGPVLQILQGIVKRLAFNNNLEVCLQVYQAERGYKLEESLQTLRPDSYLHYQTADAINLIEWSSLEEQLTMWSQHLDAFVSVLLASEYSFCKELFSEAGPDAMKQWKDVFGRMAMQVGLALFIEFGEAFTKSQMEPQKLFKLLDMFECLGKLKPEFEEMFDGGGVVWRSNIQKKIWSFERGLVEGVARVLQEMKYRIEMQEESSGKNLEKSIRMSKGGAVLKIVSYTVNYLNYMLSEWYKPLLHRALEAEQSVKKTRHSENIDALKSGAGEEEEAAKLLYTAVLEIMQALDKTIAFSAGRLLGMPAYASFFLMNNYSYIYTRSVGSDLGALLGEGWLRKQLDKMELCAMQYKQEAWGQLVALVNCEGLSSSFNRVVGSGSSSGRKLIRQRAEAFQASLHTLVARHNAWSIPNEDLRRRICHDVLQSVIPTYRSFLERYSHFLSSERLDGAPSSADATHLAPPDEGNSPALMQLDNTIIKYTPERVEHMLTSIFEVRFQPHHIHNLAEQISSTDVNKRSHTHSTVRAMSDNESASQTSYSDQEASDTSIKKAGLVRFHKPKYV